MLAGKGRIDRPNDETKFIQALELTFILFFPLKSLHHFVLQSVPDQGLTSIRIILSDYGVADTHVGVMVRVKVSLERRRSSFVNAARSGRLRKFGSVVVYGLCVCRRGRVHRGRRRFQSTLLQFVDFVSVILGVML